MKPILWYLEACPEGTWTEPEQFNVRGIGSEWKLACLVTGEHDTDATRLLPNISAFVKTKEAGERVVRMFGGRARLDFREFEPNWIQVKVGVLPAHLLALELIEHYTMDTRKISHKLVHTALMRETAVREDPSRASRLLPDHLIAKYR